MFRKTILFHLGLIAFFSFNLAQAELLINEVMYDLKTGTDDGREWIEIFNNGNVSVDLASYRFFEADTNHKLILFQGNQNIEAQSYAVIASNPVKFRADWPSFSGTIFDSTFSLGNSGETLALKDKDLNIIDQYVYNSSLGAKGDGKSLQRKVNFWVAASPTPGMENKIIEPIKTPTPSPASIKIPKTVDAPKKDVQVSIKKEKQVLPIEELPKKEMEIPAENLLAEVIENDLDTANNLWSSVVGLIVLTGIGAGAAYYIRYRNRQQPRGESPGSDFEILE